MHVGLSPFDSVLQNPTHPEKWIFSETNIFIQCIQQVYTSCTLTIVQAQSKHSKHRALQYTSVPLTSRNLGMWLEPWQCYKTVFAVIHWHQDSLQARDGLSDALRHGSVNRNHFRCCIVKTSATNSDLPSVVQQTVPPAEWMHSEIGHDTNNISNI